VRFADRHRPLSGSIAALSAICHILITRREDLNLVCLKLFFWIACFLIVGEFGLEVRAKQRGWESILFGLPTSVQSVPQRGQGDDEFGPTSSFPFRSRIIPMKKESGNRRYWVASSSHAEDIYLPPSMTFPNILEHLLREERGNAVVLNASRAGIDIPENSNDLKRWGRQWQPNIVILYQMSLPISSIAKRTLSGTRGQASPAMNQMKKAGGPVTWVNRLVEKTTIYANVKGQVSARIGASRVLANDLGLQGEEEFSSMLQDFIETTRAIGSVPVLTTFATSHIRKQLAVFPNDIALGLFKYSSFLSVEGWVTSVERLNAVVRRIAAQEGIMLIDLEGSMSGHPEFFRDFIHFTPAGHEAVARTMKDALIELEREEAAHSAVQRRVVR
jgi:hypothetical protein